MSGIGSETISDNAISGRAAYYFDFAPVLAKSKTLSRNPERVQLMCEPCVKRLAPGDIMLPQDSGFFLVVLSADGSAAEALVHEINIALLELFFGTDALAHGLSTISRKASVEEIEARGIAIPSAPKPLSDHLPAGTARVEEDPLARLAQSGVPGYAGLSTGFVPLINLHRELAAIHLCGAVRNGLDRGGVGETLFGAAALSAISAKDRASLDEALLEYSLGFARGMLPTRSATAIMTPVHYETLAWPRGRQLFLKQLRAVQGADLPFLMVKIEGIPPGTPFTRLQELVTMLRPHVKRIFVELPECDHNLLRGGLVGAAGFISALPDGLSLHAAGRAMSNLVQLAASQHAVACIANVVGANQLALARTAGARFAIEAPETILSTLMPADISDAA